MVCLSPVGLNTIYPTGDKHTISTFVDQTHLPFRTLPGVANLIAGIPIHGACVMQLYRPVGRGCVGRSRDLK